jgi:hypothetical protein
VAVLGIIFLLLMARSLAEQALDKPGSSPPIGHLAEKKTSHLTNREIPQMADVSGGFLLYTGLTSIIEKMDRESGSGWAWKHVFRPREDLRY